MKKIKSKIYFLTSIIIILLGCQKNETINKSYESKIDERLFVNSQALEQLAIITAANMHDQEFRDNLKTEALKQIDGDYDIIYDFIEPNSHKSSSVSSDNFYINKLSSGLKGSESQSKDFVLNLINQIPKFQISIPIKCKEWDTKSQIPLVSYVPVGFDEKTFTHIKAFDQNGIIKWLPIDKIPNLPIIILGSNERMDEYGNIVYNSNGRKSSTNYDLPEDDDGGGGGGYSPYGITDATIRTDGLAEYIGQLKVDDLSDIEPWLLGKPEILVKVYSSTGTLLKSTSWNPDRDNIDGVWYTVNTKLFNWYWSDYGNYLGMQWIEEDGGNITSLPVSFFGLTIYIPLSSNDENMGFSVVNKLDSKTYIYDGMLGFHWKENF